MTRSRTQDRSVTAVVPVKSLVRAKSRLVLPPVQRRELALAFALDTVTALCGAPLVSDVLVVTSDSDVRRRVGPLGVRVCPEEGIGLDAAVRGGIGTALARSPARGLAVVPADLPCLRPGDVTEVLEAGLAAGGAFVADRAGTGTTLVVAAGGYPLLTRYGPGSASTHEGLGLRRLDGAPERARLDVDTLDDLGAALRLGTGPMTAGVVAGLGLDDESLASGA